MSEWIVSSSVLIILIVIIRQLFRRKMSLRMRYALWLVVALRLLIPVSFFQSSFSVLNLLEWAAAAGENYRENPAGSGGQLLQGMIGDDVQIVSSEISRNGEDGEDHQQFVMPDQSGGNGQPDMPHFAVSEQIANEQSVGELQFTNTGRFIGEVPLNLTANLSGNRRTARLLYMIWLAGAAVCSIVLLMSNISYRRSIYLSRTRCPAAGDSILPVYVSSAVRMPCMFGLLHPAVYLTPEVAKGQKTLKHVLCHENTHYRHHDNLWVLVRAVCFCLHWYNPLVWLAAHLSVQDCELACDEETLEQLGGEERIDYGRTLLELSVQDGVLLGSLQLSTSLTGRKKQLKERLQMVVRQPEKYIGASMKVLLLMCLVSMIAFTGKKGAFAQKESGFEENMDHSGGADGDVGNHVGIRNESISDGLGDSALAYSYGSSAANYESVSVPVILNGEKYTLRIFSEAVQEGGYRIPRVDLCRAEEGKTDEEILQSIYPGKAKPLYIANGYLARENNISRLSYKLEENPLYVKALREFDNLPLFAKEQFLADDNGSAFSDSPDGNVLVADLNGDGYEDFCLQVKTGGDNVPYFCYLWDNFTGQFKPDAMIPNAAFDEETRMIISATVEGEYRDCIKYYRYDDYGRLQLVRYVEEDRTQGVLFPHWDLTYCQTFYSLPAAESRWEYAPDYAYIDYDGEMPERLIVWAKKALTELYEWSGTKIDTVCFTATEFGDFYFANTPEDIYASRTFYSRCYGKRAGFEEGIEQMSLSTERVAWYSPVIQWNIPNDLDHMTDIQVIEWYFERSALSEGEQIEWVRPADEGIEGSYIIQTVSENYYEFDLNLTTREVNSVTGPYDTYPMH